LSAQEQSVQYLSTRFEVDCEKYSSATKLLRVITLFIRFVNKLRKKSIYTRVLDSSQLEIAENMWIYHTQRKCFSDVFEAIQNQKQNNLQRQLGLVLDENANLRCKGRMEYADLTEGARQPILLPKGEWFNRLIVEKTHTDVLHSGVSQTLSSIRTIF